MNPLWLRIEQQAQGTASVKLWEGEFGTRQAPMSSARLSLQPLSVVNAAGLMLWKKIVDQVRLSPAPSVGQFDEIGDTLRQVLAACPVWSDWLQRWKAQTRTYFEVVDLPGEAMRLSDLPFEYLANVTGVGPVDRYFSMPDRPLLRVHSATAAPLKPIIQGKVLLICGESIDWTGARFPGDDIEAAYRELQTCAICAHVQILETPDLQTLEDTLDKVMPDIIHFSGHGEISPRTNLPALRIALPGDTWWWDTDRINGALAGKSWCPRLVVLNACDGAVAAGPFASVVSAFARNGVPAIIGAQAAIRQISAPLISTALYNALVGKLPIDVAMAKVRSQIGNRNGGADWHQRDWGLPVLTVAASPDELFARAARPGLPDPERLVASCSVLSEYLNARKRTVPFVALGWPDERLKCLDYLSSAHCIVVRGTAGSGKTRLAQRALRDAAFLGQQVRYVELCGGKPDANFIDVLCAIVDGDASQQNSQIHKPLKADWFSEFNSYRNLDPAAIATLPLERIEQICGAFERGLQNACSGQELTIVLDQFRRDNRKTSFSPDEFKTKLSRYLWSRVADGKVPGLRVIFVVRDDRTDNQYEDYGLIDLRASEVPLRMFDTTEHAKLFYELCRFPNKPISARSNLSAIKKVEDLSLMLIQNSPTWPASKLELVTKIIEELP
jgi:CHAT domain